MTLTLQGQLLCKDLSVSTANPTLYWHWYQSLQPKENNSKQSTDFTNRKSISQCFLISWEFSFIHATNQTLEVRTPTFQNQFLILSVAKGSGLQYLSHFTTSFACWTPRHEDDTSKSLCIKHIQWSHKMKLSARIYIQVSTLLTSLTLLEKDSFQFIDSHLDSLIYVINLSSL